MNIIWPRNPVKRIYPKDIKKIYKRTVYRDYHHSIIKLAKTTYKTKKCSLKFWYTYIRSILAIKNMFIKID